MTALANPVGVEHGLKYCIVHADGTRAVLNDATDADFVGFVDADNGGIAGLERAGVRENADVLPEADGGVHGAFRRDRLAFTINAIVPPTGGSDSWLARQAKLLYVTNALRADSTLQWTPSEAGVGQVELGFREQQPTRLTGRRPKRALIAGVSEQPVVRSALLSVLLTPSGAVGGGFASPLTSLLGSSATAIGALNITLLGNAETWPLYRFDGPAVNPYVVNGATGRGLYLTYTLNAGEYLLVDSDPRRRTVLLNGTGNRYSAIDWTRSSWAPLIPKIVNDLHLGYTSYSAGAALTVYYRNAWG